jgi:hypothetical protein
MFVPFQLLKTYIRNPFLFFISFFTLSLTRKRRWQPRSACAWVGEFCQVSIFAKLVCKPLKANFLILPKLYGCQVDSLNCWSCSCHPQNSCPCFAVWTDHYSNRTSKHMVGFYSPRFFPVCPLSIFFLFWGSVNCRSANTQIIFLKTHTVSGLSFRCCRGPKPACHALLNQAGPHGFWSSYTSPNSR